MSNSFYLWIFENYCDRNNNNWSYRDRRSEYGCGPAEMLDQYPDEAIEDAKKKFEEYNDEEKKGKITAYRVHLRMMISSLTKELENANHYGI